MARIELHNLSKSCNEALILGVLADGPKHGYQVALEIEQRSGGYFKFYLGTLYPILHKLEKDGFIKGTWAPDSGRRKKLYALTDRGGVTAREVAATWRTFFQKLGGLLETIEP
ncbi:PadR family transcriptional regulator [Candidatus Eisenbacteria bacterium]|uniref:PadR family transcriptional regulator n=1 Tax=Eiseniibacteriota bacterium TaxID=2212470 RepID=A0ABV6YJ53_UNCEI